MRALLISTYDLGRQPFGLASPAAWIRRAGADVTCVDTSRDELDDRQLLEADLIAFYLPMHTATRLAAPLVERARRVNPAARLCAYGLYAPLNGDWLRARGIEHVLGPEAEDDLARLASSGASTGAADGGDAPSRIPRLAFMQPDRGGLPAAARYASLQMPDGSRRVAGSTEATRGCKHLCRHCPIVPVYQGQFRVVPVDVVQEDIRSQVRSGARHISFGDPDFLNGPGHARRVIEALAGEFPDVTYDVTIKVEHLLAHADMLPLLRDTGCLFVTSAVESVDDRVLAALRKGHTRADFVRVAELCRTAGVTLAPTFVPFTPWTTTDGYVDLLDVIDSLDLVEHVAPIQLAIRLLVTSGSALLDLPDVAGIVAPFDAASLTWPWTHTDPRVDQLQAEVMSLVGARLEAPRGETFDLIAALARGHAGVQALAPVRRPSRGIATISEPWYCCAEPGPQQLGSI